ncbi:hypothetical protein SAMN05216184_115100 [Georgenia satyanarayanai]|uniref:GH15-like domain-containing protein n=1 Tax=Georgenia satyanarayanai TaxID=860221 RepID=A0A2Y9AP61_9MICO|nr:glycoside hydrolase family 15 protein [Georgenia satyanarayanai]PYF97389.1 hypothetical protein A8987_115100 [Georgenia satyanarayanai]SSA46170.1 hypothetical protein SAMN05216184_115100 [Georgenia satyanarayanai]
MRPNARVVARFEEDFLDMFVVYSSDFGLLSEEYDPGSGRLAGNFRQAFSHLGFIRATDAIRAAGAAD